MLPVKTVAEVLGVPEVSCANWNCTHNLCQCLGSVATTSVLYLLYLNMFPEWWVWGIVSSCYCWITLWFLFYFLPLDQTDPWLMPQFTTTLFGAVVTSRLCSSDYFIWSLIRWLKLGEAMTLKKGFCLFWLLFLQTSFLSGSSKTWQPVTGDGLSLLDPLSSTGDILNVGYIDMKRNYAVSILSWLSVLFHTLNHLTQGWPGCFVVISCSL